MSRKAMAVAVAKPAPGPPHGRPKVSRPIIDESGYVGSCSMTASDEAKARAAVQVKKEYVGLIQVAKVRKSTAADTVSSLSECSSSVMLLVIICRLIYN